MLEPLRPLKLTGVLRGECVCVCAPDSRPPSLEDLRGLVASANTIVLTSLVPARQRRFSLASHRTAYCRSL